MAIQFLPCPDDESTPFLPFVDSLPSFRQTFHNQKSRELRAKQSAVRYEHKPIEPVPIYIANKSSERTGDGQLIAYGQRVAVSVSHVAWREEAPNDPCVGRPGRARELEAQTDLRTDILLSAAIRGRVRR